MTENEILESIEGHRRRNAELLRLIKEKNADTNEVRGIEHHFWAGTQQSAAALGKELYKAGFLVLVICPADHDGDDPELWNVEAEAQQTIIDAASPKVASELVRLAARLDAEYDGWGTSI